MNKYYILISLLLIALSASVGYGYTGSVYTGTYYDAATTNTTGVTVNPPATTDLTTAKNSKLWFIRGFANGGSIYEGDAQAGAFDYPMMKTALTGLNADMPYDVYVVYWSDTGDWDVLAGFASTALTKYSRTLGSARLTGGVDGNRNEYEAKVGTAFADGSGNLTVYIDDDDVTPTQRSWYDGLVYKLAYLPYRPVPASQALNVALTATLSFQPVRDPNNAAVADPRIVEHRIHINTDPAKFSDPNAIIPAGQAIAFNPALQPNATYYWRVDEKLNNGTTITGVVWSFQTIKTVPDFNPPLGTQPVDTWINLGDSGQLKAVAGTTGGLGGTMRYQWYRGLPNDAIADIAVADAADHITGSKTSTLTLVAQAGDEGNYYCAATNDVGNAPSAAVRFMVKRAMAHWTLDQANYQSDLYQDSSGEGHHADPNGVPTFVNGVADQPATAVQFGDNQSWANGGTWSPSAVTGQLSIALWANVTGETGNIQGMVSKRDAFTDAGMMWSFRRNADGALSFNTTSGAVTAAIPFTLNRWQYLVVSYNGQTATLYVDGRPVTTGAIALNTGAAVNIWLGKLDGSATYLFNGALDDVFIFNYALDAYDVARRYTQVRTGESICVALPANDFNQDCVVNLSDFALFAAHWLECGKMPLSVCP